MDMRKRIVYLYSFLICIYESDPTGVTMRQLGDRLIQLRIGKIRGVKVEFPDNIHNLRSVERYSGLQYGTLRGTRGNILRFFPPSSNMPSWGNQVKEYTQFSNVCPQDDVKYMSLLPEGSARKFMKIAELLKGQNEDCLYLNIWSPIPASRSPKSLTSPEAQHVLEVNQVPEAKQVQKAQQVQDAQQIQEAQQVKKGSKSKKRSKSNKRSTPHTRSKSKKRSKSKSAASPGSTARPRSEASLESVASARSAASPKSAASSRNVSSLRAQQVHEAQQVPEAQQFDEAQQVPEVQQVREAL